LSDAAARWISTAEAVELARKQTEVESNLVRQSKIHRRGRFLKGPIPLPEIAAASRLPGKALAVLVAIHHQSDLTGKPSVTLPAKLLAELGISRGAKSRGLKLLEQAGLVTIARSKGRAARIQLVHNGGDNVSRLSYEFNTPVVAKH
jgi:DNA-binding MarR family transcriptional regulator